MTTPASAATKTCPTCGEPVDVGAGFCEACGTRLEGAVVATPSAAAVDELAPISTPTNLTPTGGGAGGAAAPDVPRPCLSCGGTVGPDGFCEVCGTKQPRERDHFRETPASWVAGVCDRGLVHSKNEDAMALLASEPQGSRAVLVVLDGVSSSVDSDVGSLAGARAAREVLRTPMPSGMGTPESRTAAVTATFAHAVDAAQDAIVATTAPDSPSPASATFVCAVLEGSRLSVANVGDSRAYWVPDVGDAVQLTRDDSVAEELIEAGMPREAAENGPQGHTITRWLGKDAPDIAPRVAERDLDAPGWVLVCSDGLWNYASEPSAIQDRFAAAVATSTPLDLALALTGFASSCGGRDNITVTLARFEPVPSTPTPNERESDG